MPQLSGNEPILGLNTKIPKSLQKGRDPVISASLGRSIFNHPVKVQKMVKHDQCFLKTCSRDNRPPTLTYDSF
jgi:hypothetical protein